MKWKFPGTGTGNTFITIDSITLGADKSYPVKVGSQSKAKAREQSLSCGGVTTTSLERGQTFFQQEAGRQLKRDHHVERPQLRPPSGSWQSSFSRKFLTCILTEVLDEPAPPAGSVVGGRADRRGSRQRSSNGDLGNIRRGRSPKTVRCGD
jgi:hypothetical protein